MRDRSAIAPEEGARLVRILDEYLAQAAEGNAPDKRVLLARYPELAADLEACLASLDFIGQAVDASGPVTAAEVALPAARILGDFQIVREVGRGGMGVVYEARQLSLDRRVALKVLPFAGMLEPRQLQRFKNEAQAAAQLDHPHIVDVIAVGCDRAVHFYAMRFIEGQSLAEVIGELRQASGTRECLGSIDGRQEPEVRSQNEAPEDRRSKTKDLRSTVKNRRPRSPASPPNRRASITARLRGLWPMWRRRWITPIRWA